MSAAALGAAAAAAASLISADRARADISLYEPFNYDPTTVTLLKGQIPDGIRTWSVAGAGGETAGIPQPASGNLALPAGMPGVAGNMGFYGNVGEGTRIDVSSDHVAQAVDGLTVYYSYAIRVNDLTHLAPSSVQILTSFIQQTGGGTGSQTSLGAVIYTRPGSASGTYNLGISSHAGGTNEIVWEAPNFALGSTQFLVASDTMTTAGINADDVSRLWLNPPSLGGGEPTPDIMTKITDFNPSATVGDMNTFGSFLIRRQPSGTVYSDSVNLDELRLGTTYAAVTPTNRWIRNDSVSNWSSPTSWSSFVPNAAGAYANFQLGITAARQVNVDQPVVVGAINFDNPNGYTLAGSSITINMPAGDGAVNALSGNHTIASPLILNRNTTFNVKLAASTLTVNDLTAAGQAVVKSGAGTMLVNRMRGSGLNVQAGKVQMIPDGGDNGASVVDSLTIAGATDAWTAKLDLANNDMIVHADGGSRAAKVDQITNQLKQGLNATTNSNQALFWSGNGIITSNGWKGGSNYTGVGVLYNDFQAAGQPTSAPIYTSFDGQSVGVNDVLMKYTWFGDADLNGQVNSSDYFQIDTGFLGAKTGWINGDFDYDGTIGSNDYFLIDSAFLAQGGTVLAPDGVTAVPEPVGVGLLGAAVVFGLRNRKRRG